MPSCSRYTKSTCTTAYPSCIRSEYSSFCFGNTRPVGTTSILPPGLITSVHAVGSVRRSTTFGSRNPPSPSNCALQTASEAKAQLLYRPPIEVGVLEGDLKGTPYPCSMSMISLVTFAVTSCVTWLLTSSLMASTSTFEYFLFLYMLVQSGQYFHQH